MTIDADFRRDEAIRLLHAGIALRNRGRLREWLAALEAARALADDHVDVLVPLLNARALTEKRLGDFDASRRSYHELIELFTSGRADDPITLAAIIDNVGFVEREAGDLSTALRWHDEAVSRLRALDAPDDLAHALTNLAVVQKDLGMLQQAQVSLNDALAVATDRGTIAHIQSVSGLVHQRLREWDTARRAFATALLGFRATENGENAAVVIHNLATVAYERGRRGIAFRLLRLSMSINARFRITAGVANDLWRLGLYTADAGAMPEARALLLKARRAARRCGDVALEARCELDIARVAYAQSQLGETVRRSTAALTRARQLGDPFLLHEILLARGTALWRGGDVGRARADFEGAIDALERLRDGTVTETLSLRFFVDVADAHQSLIALAVEQEDNSAAWEWVERRRGRELEKRIRRSLALIPRNTPAELIVREQELLMRLDRGLSELESAPSTEAMQRVDQTMRDVREVWQSLEQYDAEYSALRRADSIGYSDFHALFTEWSRTLT